MKSKIDDNILNCCPICSGSIKEWRTKTVGSEKYKIDLCKNCGYAFVNPKPSLDFLMSWYSNSGHGDIPENITDINIHIQNILAKEQSEPNSTIDAHRMIKTIKSYSLLNEKSFLDVGCGYGFFSIEAIKNNFDVISLELANCERIVSKELTGIDPIANSFEDLDIVPDSLSVILMSQILEHAYDVNLWISKSHNLLADKGVIAIALPNFGSLFRILLNENEPYICPPAHLNFFTAKSLSCLLDKHGFEVLKIEWVSRIPIETFAKRLPSIIRPAIPLINFISKYSLKVVDAFHLGMMINVYARKKAR